MFQIKVENEEKKDEDIEKTEEPLLDETETEKVEEKEMEEIKPEDVENAAWYLLHRKLQRKRIL